MLSAVCHFRKWEKILERIFEVACVVYVVRTGRFESFCGAVDGNATDSFFQGELHSMPRTVVKGNTRRPQFDRTRAEVQVNVEVTAQEFHREIVRKIEEKLVRIVRRLEIHILSFFSPSSFSQGKESGSENERRKRERGRGESVGRSKLSLLLPCFLFRDLAKP